MPYQPIVDTALGLFLIYFVGALFTAGLVEALSNLLKKRAKALLLGLHELLSPSPPDATAPGQLALQTVGFRGAKNEAELYIKALSASETEVHSAPAKQPYEITPAQPPFEITVTNLLAHPLILPFQQARAGKKVRNPSYIPSHILATALYSSLPAVPTEQGGSSSVQPRAAVAVSDAIAQLGDGRLKEALSAMASVAGNDLDRFLEQVEKWYDAEMDRVNGAYRRWAKKWGVVAAVVVVGLLHVDSVDIAKDLWTNESLRVAVAAAAIDTTCEPTRALGTPPTPTSEPANQVDCVQQQIKLLASDGLPIGWEQWNTWPSGPMAWVEMVVGFVISVAAISMGAPFWFTVMNTFINVRNTGTPPNKGQTQ